MVPRLKLAFIPLLLMLAAGASAQTATTEREGVVIVMDASTSMWGEVDGRPKIEIAREGVAALVAAWNPDADLGLIAYGHRREGDCTDIETLLPVGPLDAAGIAALVDGLTPRGKTPLTAAVRQAAEALRYADRPATVILFSDGLETCNADPCALAEELERAGVRFTAHVVGFDVAEGQEGLACLAEATGGLYLTADNTAQLTQALTTVGAVAADPAMADLITLEAVDEGGGVLAEGVTWSVVSLDSEDAVPISAGVARPVLPLGPGAWRAEARTADAAGSAQFEVVEGRSDTIRVPLASAGATAPAAPPASATASPPPAPALDGAEPNDTFGTATPATFDDPISGAIDPVGDGDYYLVTVPGPGVLSISASAVPAGIELVAEVLDADFGVVRGWTDPFAPGAAPQTADLPAAGRYVVELRDSYNDAAAPEGYAAAFAFTPAEDETEPNDSFGRAAPLTLGEAARMSIFPTGRHDFLEVTVDRRGELVIEATGVPAAIGVAMHVMDAGYGAVGDWVAGLNGEDVRLAVDLPRPGRYVVEVADDRDDARDPAAFTLSAAFTPSEDALEPNDSFATAVPLVLGAPVRAAILPRGDADFYVFDVAHAGELTAVASGVPPALNLSLAVHNQETAVVGTWVYPTQAGQDTILVADLPAAGRYVLEVRDAGDDARAVEPYTLQASFVEAADEGEPNGRVSEATPLPLDVPVTASILPMGDGDVFLIEAPAPGELTVTASGVPAELDIAMLLRDRELAGVGGWAFPSHPGQDTVLTAALRWPGRYVLDVRDNADDARSPQPFTLTATLAPAAGPGEADDTPRTPRPLVMGVAAEDSIFPRGNHDWYVIDAAAAPTPIAVTGGPAAIDLAVRVLDEAGAVVADWRAAPQPGADLNVEVTPAAPGRLLVEVADQWDDAASLEPYTILAGTPSAGTQAQPAEGEGQPGTQGPPPAKPGKPGKPVPPGQPPAGQEGGSTAAATGSTEAGGDAAGSEDDAGDEGGTTPAAAEDESEDGSAEALQQLAWLQLPTPPPMGGDDADLDPFAGIMWTQWMNLDQPDADGDLEELSEFVRLGWVCAAPAAVECRTFDGRDWQAAGQVYACEPQRGGICAEADQPAGQHCLDYEVRFRCQ